MRSLLTIVALSLWSASISSAFTVQPTNAFAIHSNSNHRSTATGARGSRSRTQQFMLPADISSMLISTIDSDIAKMSTNEFAPVFRGGLMIMFGGFVSTAVVGLILKAGSNYGNVIAESYAKNLEDLEGPGFLEEMPLEWKALFEDNDLWEELSKESDLSNEDLVKRVEARRKEIFKAFQEKELQEQQQQQQPQEQADVPDAIQMLVNGEATKQATPVGGEPEKPEVDIFSDYEA